MLRGALLLLLLLLLLASVVCCGGCHYPRRLTLSSLFLGMQQ
jgi:hypothetical protein